MLKHLKTLKYAGLAAAALFAATAASAQVNLTSNTGQTGNAIGLTAASLAEYAAERGIANIQLKDGQTATNYMLALAEGKIDIGNGPFIIPFLLSNGAGPFSKVGKEKGAELGANIQLLYPYTLSVFSLVAYDSFGITKWEDLKGRKVLNGPPRGGAVTNSRSLVQLFAGLKADEDYESVTVNWNQAISTIVDGTADAAVIPFNFPGPRVSQSAAAGSMTMVSLPKDAYETEAAQRLLNKPGTAAFEAPLSEIRASLGDNWTILSDDDTFRGMAAVGGDFVNKSMDEALAYELTKAHIENLDRQMSIAPFMSTLNFGNLDPEVAGLCGRNPVKFHPGAVRAWEEAGFDVAECAKP